MTVALVLVAALALALFALRTARGHAVRVQGLDQLEGLTRPLDLPAFLNLIDPGEQEFLRTQLPPGVFRRIQRARLRAGARYLTGVAHNAAVLVQAGESLRGDTLPEIATAGEELMNAAVQLRALSLLALALVYTRMAFPRARISLFDVPHMYERVLDRLAYLARLKHPAQVGRILQAL